MKDSKIHSNIDENILFLKFEKEETNYNLNDDEKAYQFLNWFDTF